MIWTIYELLFDRGIDSMEEKRVCFVIMPISEIAPYEEGHFKRVYEYVIKPAVIKAGFTPLRADEVKQTNFIIIDILKQIVKSSMCICDISARNPNVLYELGIRQAYRLPVTIIRDSKTPRIFDIQGLRDIEYNENLRIDNVNCSIESIAETIMNTYYNTDNDVNSIVDLLGVFPSTFLQNISSKDEEVHNPEKYDLKVCIDNFLIFKETEGTSKKTVREYRQQLQYLVEYTNKQVNEFNKDDIRDFLSKREENSKINSNSTLNRIRLILKLFFDWLVDESLIAKNPVNRIRPYKINDTYMEVLSETEFNEIRNACISKREKALTELLYSTGCNVSELVNLKISKIDWDANEIAVDNKTKSNRLVFLTHQAVVLLKEYLDSREDDCKEVFVTLRKPYRKMGSRAIQREIKQIVKRTDIKKEVTPRIFRNTFTKIMMKKGCPVNVLQSLLGHKLQSSTVATSFRLNVDNKKEIYQKYYSE